VLLIKDVYIHLLNAMMIVFVLLIPAVKKKVVSLSLFVVMITMPVLKTPANPP